MGGSAGSSGEPRDLTPDLEAVLAGSEAGGRQQSTHVCVHTLVHCVLAARMLGNRIEANQCVQRAVEKRWHGAFEKKEKIWFGSSSTSELGTKKRGNERGRKDGLWNLRIGIHRPGNGKTLKGVDGKIVCLYPV